MSKLTTIPPSSFPPGIYNGYITAGRFLLPFSVWQEDARLEAEEQAAAEAQAEAEALAEEQAALAKIPAPVVEPPPPQRVVPVFQKNDLCKARQKVSEKDKHMLDLLRAAEKHEGLRPIPEWPDLTARLTALRAKFPNFWEMLEALECELVLASAQAPEHFRVAPLLLAGDPGIGKTFLASELAKALDLPFAKISAGGAQGPFDFVGTSSHWSNAQPGRLFELLAQADSASGVLLIDEVDKMHQGERYPILPALLDLLEGDSARRFRDEAFGVEFDASRLIIVLTANDLEAIQKPLLSRLQVYTAEAPTTGQRCAIIQGLLAKLQEGTAYFVTVPESECTRLAEASALDLRELKRIVTRAYATALVNKCHQLTFELPARAARRRMGFI